MIKMNNYIKQLLNQKVKKKGSHKVIFLAGIMSAILGGATTIYKIVTKHNAKKLENTQEEDITLEENLNE